MCRPGSVIAELVITVKGILSEAMYDTLRMAIQSGKIGELNVAVVPGKIQISLQVEPSLNGSVS